MTFTSFYPGSDYGDDDDIYDGYADSCCSAGTCAYPYNGCNEPDDERDTDTKESDNMPTPFESFLNGTTDRVISIVGFDYVAAHKIQSIKIIRQLTACGLKEAKDAVERAISERRGAYITRTAADMNNGYHTIGEMRAGLNHLDDVLAEEKASANEPRDGFVMSFSHVTDTYAPPATLIARRDGKVWTVTGRSQRYAWKDFSAAFPAVSQGQYVTLFDGVAF